VLDVLAHAGGERRKLVGDEQLGRRALDRVDEARQVVERFDLDLVGSQRRLHGDRRQADDDRPAPPNGGSGFPIMVCYLHSSCGSAMAPSARHVEQPGRFCCPPARLSAQLGGWYPDHLERNRGDMARAKKAYDESTIQTLDALEQSGCATGMYIGASATAPTRPTAST